MPEKLSQSIKTGKGVILISTIKDVAREAGVSVATVSRVINNRGYLSDAIKEKVQQAMEALDYIPNELARSLHNQKSHILGLIVPSVSHPFFGEVVQWVEQMAYEQGYKVLICNSLQNRQKEREYIDMLKRSQVDGIVMGSHVQDIDDYMGLTLPVISLDRKLSETIPYVCADNAQGGRMATEHLLARGCRCLMHISGSLEVQMLSNRRTDAFVEVCRAAGAPFFTYELPDRSVVQFHEEDYLRDLLEKHPEVDGVFATSDVTAAYLVRQAKALGRRVPEDLQVVGFDGGVISGLTSPSLTTIRQPMEVLSRYVVENLLRLIAGEAVPTKTILPITLVQGESTKAENTHEAE